MNQVAAPERTLVLGGGFIGSHVANVAYSEGHNVTVFTRSQPVGTRAKLMSGCELILGDALKTDPSELIQDGDHIVFALGVTYPSEFPSHPMDEVVVALQPLLGTLEAMRARKNTSLMYISSGGTVYGEAQSVPIPESAPTEPSSGYGVLKLSCEKYIQMYKQRHKVNATIARVANPYGPGQEIGRGQGLVAAFLGLAANGETAMIFGDGQNVRDYIHIHDVAEALHRLAAARSAPPVVNVGTGLGHSINDVLALVEKVSGSSIPVEYLPDRGFDVRTNVLDNRLLRQVTGIAPRSLEVGLPETWEERSSPLNA